MNLGAKSQSATCHTRFKSLSTGRYSSPVSIFWSLFAYNWRSALRNIHVHFSTFLALSSYNIKVHFSSVLLWNYRLSVSPNTTQSTQFHICTIITSPDNINFHFHLFSPNWSRWNRNFMTSCSQELKCYVDYCYTVTHLLPS